MPIMNFLYQTKKVRRQPGEFSCWYERLHSCWHRTERYRKCTNNVTLWSARVTTFFNGNATLCSVCVVGVISHCQQCTQSIKCVIMILWRVNAGNNTTCYGHRVQYRILSDFHHIWSSSSDFHISPPHDMPRKSVQWQPRWYNVDSWTRRTDGRTDSL